jgi:hypothetical protein
MFSRDFETKRLSADAEDALLPRAHFHERVMVAPAVGNSSCRIILADANAIVKSRLLDSRKFSIDNQ